MALNDDLEKGNKLLSDRLGINEEVIDGLRDYTNVLQDQLKLVEFHNQEKREISSATREINRIAQQNYTILEKELGTEKLLKKIGQDKEKLVKRIGQLNQLSGKNLTNNNKLQTAITSEIQSTISTTQDLLGEMDGVEKITKSISENLGVKTLGALSDISKSIPGLSRFSKPFDKASEAARLTTSRMATINAERVKLGKKPLFSKKQMDLSSIKSGFKSLTQSLKKSLGPAAILKELYSTFKESDKAVGELAKSMGTSYGEASNLRGEMTKMSFQSNSIFVNTKNMQESMMALNKEFGTATSFSGEMLDDFTRLTKEAGYNVETVGKLSRLTTLTGTDLSDNTSEILGQAQAYKAVNKVSLNTKQIVEDVSKTSSATTLSLGANPKLIASANIAARALGTTLEKVEAISSSLLNFEQSISNELEAELLIGKELNLEVAREAALRGQVGKVAEEIAKQVGTSAEFGAMNVIQQEALAKAVGMSREDLAKTLIDKENLVKLGTKDKDLQSAYNTLKAEGLSDDEIATKLGDDKLASQLKSASVQERLTASVEKMKEIFVAIAEPIGAIISQLVDILSPVITFISSVVGHIVEGFKIMGPVLKPVLAIIGTIALAMKTAAIFAAIKGIWSGLGPIPFIGPALAIAGIAGAIGYINSIQQPKSIGDGAFGADGSTQISTREGGLYEISPNDDVVVAPGAIDKMNQPGGGNIPVAGNNVNQSGIIAELKRNNQLLTQLLQKNTNIEIDGTILNKKIQQSTSPIG